MSESGAAKMDNPGPAPCVGRALSLEEWRVLWSGLIPSPLPLHAHVEGGALVGPLQRPDVESDFTRVPSSVATLTWSSHGVPRCLAWPVLTPTPSAMLWLASELEGK